MNNEKNTPTAISAEQSIIGALLQNNDAIDGIGSLKVEHFYRHEHRIIYEEILKQISTSSGCDLITVSLALSSKVENCMSYLNEITQNTPHNANITRYTEMVRESAIKRGIIALSREMEEIALNSALRAIDVVDITSSKLEALAQDRAKKEPIRASKDLTRYIEELEARADGVMNKSISTGYRDLDARLSGGMRGGDLIILAARPKMGKTTAAMNIALNISRLNAVLFLSLEMPITQLHDRNFACIGNIPLGSLLEPMKMTKENWKSLTDVTERYEKLNLFVDDQGGLNLMEVRIKAKSQKRRFGLKLLVIDYLQLMAGEGSNRNSEIEGITRGLKALAKELDITIMLLSQLNRKVEERPNKRPHPSDLRDSGAIEQDADAVILMYRDEVYNDDSAEKGVCEFDVALCRQGAPGRAYLAFLGEFSRFENLNHGWRPQERPTATHNKRGIAAEL